MAKLFTISRSSENIQANVKTDRIIDKYKNGLENDLLDIAADAETWAKTPSQFWVDITGESRNAFWAYFENENGTYRFGIYNDRAWMPKLDIKYNHSARIKAYLKDKLILKLEMIKRGL